MRQSRGSAAAHRPWPCPAAGAAGTAPGPRRIPGAIRASAAPALGPIGSGPRWPTAGRVHEGLLQKPVQRLRPGVAGGGEDLQVDGPRRLAAHGGDPARHVGNAVQAGSDHEGPARPLTLEGEGQALVSPSTTTKGASKITEEISNAGIVIDLRRAARASSRNPVPGVRASPRRITCSPSGHSRERLERSGGFDPPVRVLAAVRATDRA